MVDPNLDPDKGFIFSLSLRHITRQVIDGFASISPLSERMKSCVSYESYDGLLTGAFSPDPLSK